MIKNVAELKKLILWCKEHKIKSLKLQDMSFEISELDFLESVQEPNLEPSNLSEYNTDTLVDTIIEKDKTNLTEDPDLFWSAGS